MQFLHDDEEDDDEVMLKCVIGRLIFIGRIYAKASVFHQTRIDVSYASTICHFSSGVKMYHC